MWHPLYRNRGVCILEDFGNAEATIRYDEEESRDASTNCRLAVPGKAAKRCIYNSSYRERTHVVW